MHDFSTLWKTFFHSVEKMLKTLPWYGNYNPQTLNPEPEPLPPLIPAPYDHENRH